MLPMTTGLKADPLSHSRLPPGARRSFFCRMKCKSMTERNRDEADTTTGIRKKRKNPLSEKKYVVIHCVGYIKSWKSHVTDQSNCSRSYHSKSSTKEEDELVEEASCNLSCLVALGRTLPPFNPPQSNQVTGSQSNESTTCQQEAQKTAKSNEKQEPTLSQTVPVTQAEFVGRLAMDGKFLFVDQRAVFILGYLTSRDVWNFTL